jgi:hypothetical protein
VGSALFAGLAAFYARRQAIVARRANDIALHENQLNVYKGLVRFRAHISALGAGIKEGEVWHLAEMAELSELYFSASTIPSRMNAVFEQSLKLLSLNDEWEHAKVEEPNKVSSSRSRWR